MNKKNKKLVILSTRNPNFNIKFNLIIIILIIINHKLVEQNNKTIIY